MPWAQMQQLMLLSFAIIASTARAAKLRRFRRPVMKHFIFIGSVVFAFGICGWIAQGLFPPSGPAPSQLLEPNSLVEAAQLSLRGMTHVMLLFMAGVLVCILTAISMWPLTLFGIFVLFMLRLTFLFRFHAKKGVRILIG
jgi:hypothetical protein